MSWYRGMLKHMNFMCLVAFGPPTQRGVLHHASSHTVTAQAPSASFVEASINSRDIFAHFETSGKF